MEPHGHLVIGARTMDVEILGREYANEPAAQRITASQSVAQNNSVEQQPAILSNNQSLALQSATAKSSGDSAADDNKLDVVVEAYAYNCDEDTLDVDKTPQGYWTQFFHEEFHRPLTNTLRIFFPRSPLLDLRTRINLNFRHMAKDRMVKNNHPPFVVLRVIIPQDFNVDVETDTGDVGVSKLNGRLSLKSEHGNYVIDEIRGDYCKLDHMFGDTIVNKMYSKQCQASVEYGGQAGISFNEVNSNLRIVAKDSAVNIDKLLGGNLKIETEEYHKDKINVYVHKPGATVDIHSKETPVRVFFKLDEETGLLETGKYRINSRSFGGIYFDDELDPHGVIKVHAMNGVIGPRTTLLAEEEQASTALESSSAADLPTTKQQDPLGRINVRIDENIPLFFHVFSEKPFPLGQVWEKESPHYEWATNPVLFRLLLVAVVLMYALAFRRIHRWVVNEHEQNEKKLLKEEQEGLFIDKPLREEQTPRTSAPTMSLEFRPSIVKE